MDVKEKMFLGNRLLNGGRLSLMVDYSMTINEMIAQGRYDWFDPKIRSGNFLEHKKMGEKRIQLSARLLHFKETMYTEDIVEEIKKTGYRLGNLPELLSFGTTYPNLQRGVSIIALGETWDNQGTLFAPGLGKASNYGRILKLFTYKGVWPSICHFLAVKEEE